MLSRITVFILSSILIPALFADNQYDDVHMLGDPADILNKDKALHLRDVGFAPGNAPELYNDPVLYLKYWHYEASNFSHPRTNRAECRTSGVGLEGASICDPDNILGNDGNRVDVQRKINNTIPDLYCRCSSCNSGKAPNDPMLSGRHSIMIAIGEYFGDPSDNTSPPAKCAEAKINQFSNNLRQNRWSNLQRCNDGIHIALSTADQIVTITSTERRLSTSCKKAITDKVKVLLDERKYKEYLLEIIDYIAHATKGGSCGAKSGLTQDQVIGIVCGVVFGTLFLVFMIVLCVGFFRNWKVVGGTCLGVCIGAILKAIQVAINILIIRCMNAICERISAAIPACEEPCACCVCEPLTCVEDVEAGGGGGGGW